MCPTIYQVSTQCMKQNMNQILAPCPATLAENSPLGVSVKGLSVIDTPRQPRLNDVCSYPRSTSIHLYPCSTDVRTHHHIMDTPHLPCSHTKAVVLVHRHMSSFMFHRHTLPSSLHSHPRCTDLSRYHCFPDLSRHHCFPDVRCQPRFKDIPLHLCSTE